MPAALRRATPPALPELSQPARAAPLPAAVAGDAGRGGQHPPRPRHLHDEVQPARQRGADPLAARSPTCTRARTTRRCRGCWRRCTGSSGCCCEISGMDRFSFQPGGGSAAVYANAPHHPGLPRCARGRGPAGRDHHDGLLAPVRRRAARRPRASSSSRCTRRRTGYPTLDAFKAALSERTAGLMITNPEDTGLFNPHIDRIVELVHEAGGLCHYDQANANGILGITRARDAGFDLCQFNLHKTFSSPHCSMGMPRRRRRASRPSSRGSCRRRRSSTTASATTSTTTGPTRSARCARSTACRRRWCARWRGSWRSAPTGLREVAETAVLNNNYLAARLADVPGLEVSYADGNAARRLEQIRYSWRELRRRDGHHDARRRRAGRATSASASTSRATSRGSSPSR